MSLQSIAQPAQASSGFDKLLRTAGDEQLRNMAQQYKDKDTIAFSLITQEGMRRKDVRDAAQAEATRAQMGGPPRTVADQQIANMMPAPVAPAAPMMNAGIAQLQAPNIARMADGGIAGYDDGGMYDFAQRSEPVLRMAGGGMAGYMPGFRDTGAVNAPFEDALRTTLRYEGGFVEDDAGRGPSKFGINKAANPDVDVKNLTKEQARELYKKRYWDAIGGDSLAAKDPAFAKVAFDTAVNMGVNKTKQLVAESKGDPKALLQMRQQHYDKLIEADPKKFAPYKSGWQSRLADLATSVIPSAEAGTLPQQAQAAAPAQVQKPQLENAKKTADDTAYAGLYSLTAPGVVSSAVDAGNTLFQKFGHQPANIGPMQPQQALSNAQKFGRAAGALAVPATVLQGGLGATELAGSNLQLMSGDVGRKMTANPMLSAMSGDTGLAAAIMDAAENNPQGPSKMPYKEQMTNVGKMLVGHPDIDKMREQNAKVTAAQARAEKPSVKADLDAMDREDAEMGAAMRANQQPKVPNKDDILKATKEAVPAETLFGLGKQDVMMLGLQLMASKNPRMLGALGEAGIGTLAAKTAREKAQTEKDYTEAHKESMLASAARSRAETEYLQSGARGIGAVQKAADIDYDNWLKAMQANPMLKMNITPELAAQKRQEFLDKAYKMYKMEAPAGASSAPAASSSDPLGILSKKG